MAHLYWVNPESTLTPGAKVALEGDEAHHASRVARLRQGEGVRLGDGVGTLALARALSVDPQRVELVVEDVEVTQRLRPELWLVQSLAKSGRDEAAIEASTEVGVAGIIPLQSERTVVKWKTEKAEAARARWQRIVTEASKQSLQARIPVVEAMVTTAELITQWGGDELIVLDTDGAVTASELDVVALGDKDRLAVVVGPEGGFSPGEKEAFDRLGAIRLRLGSGVLRASTAGPIGLAIVHQILGQWGPTGSSTPSFVD